MRDENGLEFCVRDKYRTAIRPFSPVNPLIQKIWEFGWHATNNGAESIYTQEAYGEICAALGVENPPPLRPKGQTRKGT